MLPSFRCPQALLAGGFAAWPDSLSFSPPNFAPSTTVWPMPFAVSSTPVPSLPSPIFFAGLDLAGGGFDLRFVGGRGRRRHPADQGRQRDRDGQESLGGHGGLPPRVLHAPRVPRGRRRRRVRRLSPSGRLSPSPIHAPDDRPV